MPTWKAQARRIALTISVADDADQVLADLECLEQVFENLTANALRHAPAGGWVRLIAVVVDSAVVLRVEDSGEGIAADHLPLVFERFYKVDPARTSQSARSGLGLSIAKAIVDRHGGTIGVASRPGRTEFTVTLPHHVEQPVQSASTNL
jgi:signal transduction histidine kinase